VKGEGLEGLGPGSRGFGIPDEEKGGLLLVQGIKEEAAEPRETGGCGAGESVVTELDLFAGGVIIQET